MGIIVNNSTKAIVLGITGSQGKFHTHLMLEYGTKIVAGTTPGKGGTSVEGVPVYDTVKEALKNHEANASIIFVPAPFAADAAFEAMENGLKTVVIITEHVPVKDSIQVMWKAKNDKITIIGPNTPGIITPSMCKLGIMPAHIFKKGVVGIASRSGTLTYEIAAGLTAMGLGQSTCVGLGGDPIVGLSFVDVLRMFEKDKQTRAVALIGEIGGNAEELAATYIQEVDYPKPVVAFVAGRTAPPGKRMGHAGAIVMGKAGTAQSKIEAFKAVGVDVAERPGDVAKLLTERLQKKRGL
ncbi:MAG: succinate--CoA ligase subunit alpha [Candidatus Bathyarchaeia archaeon]|jgi:succinyl-CoA synthetase alpha subunit|nr:succinate--CoA ligase subunit alpha [Candidatus Bathyarchaeota archaeon A05DMB-4]MDH7594916.1 succinate--CoA ligase subunit alpha [Candidatus Bathyarchaeota archaeon]